MTTKRRNKIKKEATRRMNLWLKHSSFDKMTVHGSFTRFRMAIGMNGYCFGKEDWMTEKETKAFITESEDFDTDGILGDLFDKAQRIATSD